MKIVAADWLPYALALKCPWQSSRGERRERQGWLFRLQMADGRTGWGDASPLPEFGIDEAAARAYAEETAHLDLLAQHAGLPLHQWLSGEAPVCSVAVNANLGALDGVTPASITTANEAGHTVLKLKVGRGPVADDIARLRRLTDAAPTGIRWRLDANRAWKPDDAWTFVAACNELPIEGLEEPLAEPDVAALAALQAMAGFTLAVDESVALLDAHFFRRPPVRRLVIKPARHGGLLASVELALRARAAGIEVVVTSALESACGLAACAQLAAAVAPDSMHGLATADIFAIDTGPAPRILAGRLQLPAAAGLGFAPG